MAADPTSSTPPDRPARTPGILRRFWGWLPSRVDRRVIAAAWATLVVQVGIVGTGGLVRLTGSGLGCPTWPRCTPESFVNTPEMGIHGVIEFGNRLLTFVLVVVAIVTFLFVVRMRRQRRDLFWLALAIGLYVPLQAVIGGITVLTNLNPYVVGLHYFASVILVALAAVLVVRVYAAPGPRVRAVPDWFAAVASVTSGLVLVTVVVGILVTGSGPHAGDGGAARNGLDPELMQHVHSWPAYALLVLTLVLVGGFTAHSAVAAAATVDRSAPGRRARPGRRRPLAGTHRTAHRARQHPHGARGAAGGCDDRRHDEPDGACRGCPGRPRVRWTG